MDGGVCDVPALGEQQVSQPRRRIDDFANRCVREAAARGQVENPQVLVELVLRQGEKGFVANQLAVGESELTKAVSLGHEGRDGAISDLDALVKIDFKDISAVLGKGKHSIVAQLDAFVEFKLQQTRN